MTPSKKITYCWLGIFCERVCAETMFLHDNTRCKATHNLYVSTWTYFSADSYGAHYKLKGDDLCSYIHKNFCVITLLEKYNINHHWLQSWDLYAKCTYSLDTTIYLILTLTVTVSWCGNLTIWISDNFWQFIVTNSNQCYWCPDMNLHMNFDPRQKAEQLKHLKTKTEK